MCMHGLQECFCCCIPHLMLFMRSFVKMLLKGGAGDRALNSHGNYFFNHGKSWKNHGIVFLNFCGNPEQNKEMFLRKHFNCFALFY